MGSLRLRIADSTADRTPCSTKDGVVSCIVHARSCCTGRLSGHGANAPELPHLVVRFCVREGTLLGALHAMRRRWGPEGEDKDYWQRAEGITDSHPAHGYGGGAQSGLT